MKFHKKLAVLSVSAATAFGSVITALPAPVIAAEDMTAPTAITAVEAGTSDNVVNLTFQNGYKGRITFLEQGIFRYNVDPHGEFSKYATGSGTAKIQVQPDESSNYTHPEASIEETADKVAVTCGTTAIEFDKASGKMTVKSGSKTVMAESSPLSMTNNGAIQSIAVNKDEDFYGGGTQNGRFVHTGKSINIVNESNWVDGGVASPSPFYWSTNGYGVLRNTFTPGVYDFGETNSGVMTAKHNEKEYDAYFFVSGKENKSEITKDLLGGYFKVSGNPVLLPEYAFYLGHLNCYNRDTWSNDSGSKAWTIKEGGTSGTTTYESGMASGYVAPSGSYAESLNGTMPKVNADQFQAADTPREFSAQAVIDRYQKNDMPFGWFLPNDGYGCGYGQNGYEKNGGTEAERQASLDANLENLAKFTEYANDHGVSTGLWTQSNLTPNPTEKQQLVRDFQGEVLTGGITSLKTDVAWVGPGYTFGLNGIKTAYDIVTDQAHKRPNIVTLDGWAGTQRFGTIWTGDQTGGNWEYIRFHIPTYIGQSLAGNPNIGSDMDGIFGGAPIIATRDYQWKTFTSTMLDMDGWGSFVKSPYTHGDPYTGISRMYLKLKAQLMPYIYTSAASAANIDTKNGDTGLPMIRAMMLADNSNEMADYAASTATQYQYLFGDSLLVAPIYQDTAMVAQDDPEGNVGKDIRNDIYLPGTENTVWIDYFTGEQYRGNQILSNYDAPLWKLPLFVKSGAIIPMYEENNNPVAISETNPDGLDKTKRIIEFYPNQSSEYTLYEDDGITAVTTTANDNEYGLINEVSYGGSVSTKFTSSVSGGNATVKAEVSKPDEVNGAYKGYDSNRTTKFVINVSKEPTGVDINGAAGTRINSLTDFEKLGENESGWYYDAQPEMNKYAGDEGFKDTHIINAPKVYVKFAKTDVSKNEQVAVVKGFENNTLTDANVLNTDVPAPVIKDAADGDITSSSISISWDAVPGAIGYDVVVKQSDGTATAAEGSAADYDGLHYYTEKPNLLISDQPFDTGYTFKVRTRKAEGLSEWSAVKTFATEDDPWRNTPTPVRVDWSGDIYGSHSANLAFDHIYQTGDGGFHSNNGGINETLSVDLGLVYPLDTIEYFPRDDAGNGTVTKMDIAYSMDGVNWTDLPQQSWDRNADTKTVEIEGAPLARYVRMIPRESVGTFFSASEIKINKVDGSKGFALGSNLANTEVTDADYSNLLNYKGVENSEPEASNFQKQIAKNYADLNKNEIYDVYDYSFTMRALDGGTTKTGTPAGTLFFVADKTNVQKNDIVTITMYGDAIANANAIGGIFQYNTTRFEAVIPAGTNGITPTPFIGDMENLSIVKVFDDGHATVNVAFANKGDKELYSGTRAVATFKLKAKREGTIDNTTDSALNLSQTTMVIGPTGECISKEYQHGYTESEIPPAADVTLVQSDLNLTITNEALPTDDGSNVTTLIQQRNFNGLFNGNADPSDRSFEFVWKYDGSPWNADTHKVPVTIHMGLKQPKPVKTMTVTCGATSYNGAVKKVGAVYTFEDGSTYEFTGGDYDISGTQYVFTTPADKANLAVTQIDFTVKESGGSSENDPLNGTLTLAEIAIDAKGETDVVSVDASNNVKELNIGSLTAVHAVVAPSSAYQNFKVESSNEDVVSVSCVRDGDDMNWMLTGKTAGRATITVTSLKDSTKSATYEVIVGNFINKEDLVAAVARAQAISDSNIVEDSMKATLSAALASAKSAAENPDSQDTVDGAFISLNRVLNSLRYRPADESKVINFDADTWGGSAIGGSSDCSTDANEGAGLGTYAASLDKSEDTYWHSNWLTNVGMPQHVLYDLGASYNLSDVAFLPRPGSTNGDIFEVEIQAGNDQDNLTSCGTFQFDHSTNQLTDRGWKTATFPTVEARYVKFIVKKAGGAALDSYASMAEIKFYSADNLGRDDLNLDLLNQAVTKSDAIKASDFISNDALNAFTSELAAAKVVQSSPRSQEQVDAAAASLNQALLAIRRTPSKDALPN